MHFNTRIKQLLNELNTGFELIDEAPDYHLKSGVNITSPRMTLKTKDGVILIKNTPTVELSYEDAIKKGIFNTTFTALLKGLAKYKCSLEKVYITISKITKKTGKIVSTTAVIEGLDPYNNKIFLVKKGKITNNTWVWFDEYKNATYITINKNSRMIGPGIKVRWFVTSLYPKAENLTVKEILKLILVRGSKYFIHPNGVIDVQGDISYNKKIYTGPLRMAEVSFPALPLKFGTVTGNAAFTGPVGTGENLPERIDGSFDLTLVSGFYTEPSQESSPLPKFINAFFPRYVGGNVSIRGIGVENLQNFPEVKKNDIEIILTNCQHLENLTGFPANFMGVISIHQCNNLISLEGLPKTIAPTPTAYAKSHSPGSVAITLNYLHNLGNLVGFPEVVKGDVYIEHCPSLKSLEGISKIIEGNLYINVRTLGIENNWEEEFRKYNLGDVVKGDIKFSPYSWSRGNTTLDKNLYSQAYKDALYKGGLEDVPIDI